jgi:DNA invertase Pin-like site-specific DNA recombinase
MTSQLRAARWSRVSSAQQATDDRNGLPAQREEQDRAIARLELSDTRIEWVVTESGKTVHGSREYQAMLASAGKTWDVLVVAYVSRIGRHAAEAMRAAETIAEAGASVYFAEDRISTSDEDQWVTFARECVESENYRRRLSRTKRATSETKWRRTSLQLGRAPLGYNSDWSVNEDEAALVRALFTEYAAGDISVDRLAERHGLKPERLKNTLRSRTYLGEAGYRVYDEAQPRQSRYRRARQWIAGRHEAIITEELFDRVAKKRQERTRAGGNQPTQVTMLTKLAACSCGTPLRLDGRDRQGRARVRHVSPCSAWGDHERRPTSWFEEPLKQALASIRLTDDHIERLIANRTVSAPPPPIRYDQQRAQVAKDLIARRITGQQAEHLLEEITENEHIDLDDAWRYQRDNLSPERMRLALQNLSYGRRMVRKETSDEAWSGIVRRYFDKVIYVDAETIRLIPSDEGREALVAATWPPLIEVLERPRRESNPRRRP